jgi:penicillin-binding protein 2
MSLPDRYFDWHRLDNQRDSSGAVTSERRLSWGVAIFTMLVVVVFARVASLEFSYGAAYRAEADKPLEREIPTRAMRGRILAADGTVLAHDEPVLALTVQYRFLEEPANPRWLRKLARARLPREQWRSLRHVQAEEQRVLEDRAMLHRRLASMCHLSLDELHARAQRIQQRVEALARRVNDRRQSRVAQQIADNETDETDRPWWERLVSRTLFAPDEALDGSPVTIAEELEYHVLCEHVPLEVVAEIESHSEEYRGVRIREQAYRRYPSGALAAHVLGHLGTLEQQEIAGNSAEYRPGDRIGRMGLERQFELLLRGRGGMVIEKTDRSGRLLASIPEREPVNGRDLALALDVTLQRTAESLLDSAIALRQHRDKQTDSPTAGGAIVVLDVHSGEIRAAASAPRFNANLLESGETSAMSQLLAARDKPLFDRAIKMAIPPGSVFKTLTAIALLESGTIDPRTEFDCRGFLNQPDRDRCLLYRRQGIGHGPTVLASALARSCNVYFFHFAGEMGSAPLVEWAERLGFGKRTGVDLPDEVRGQVPTPASISERNGRGWSVEDTRAVSIGQSSLAVTPLQIARLMAAVANGGKLVTPHVTKRLGFADAGSGETDDNLVAPQDVIVPEPRDIEGLSLATLAAVRQGLERVVADQDGTGHRTMYLEDVAIAGKTGTAETSGGQEDHAWFAGYAPADRPKLAFVVVLEHAGGGAESAGPVVKRLVMKMQKLGYFGRPASIAQPVASRENLPQ